MASTLPAELCGLICTQPIISRNDLRNLCTVSRAFRDEAERILNTSVTLVQLANVKSWCRAVARRPHLAQRVKKLKMTLPPQTSIEVADLSLIMHALHLCVNLLDLSTLQDERRTTGSAVHTWILAGHDFKLDRFTNTYFQPALLYTFFSSQPLLRFLSLRCSETTRLHPSTLPNLRTVDISSDILHELGNITWPKRDIHHLQYYVTDATDEEELQNLVALTQLAGSLKSLSIERHGGTDGLEITVMVACIAAQLPELKFIQIMDHTDLTLRFFVPLLPFAMRFNSIETMVLHPSNLVNREGIRTSAYPELETEVGRMEVAKRIMGNLPTLKLLVLITKSAYMFSRTEDLVISPEEENPTFDADAWMKV